MALEKIWQEHFLLPRDWQVREWRTVENKRQWDLRAVTEGQPPLDLGTYDSMLDAAKAAYKQELEWSGDGVAVIGF